MDKAAKILLNNLKCPICGGQIDLYNFNQLNPRSTGFNFCCARDFQDYQMWYPHWEPGSQISYDMVILYDRNLKFRIDQTYYNGKTNIDIWEVDPEHNRRKEESKNFSYEKILFNYPTTNRQKIFNRIKTILTFQ